ncbi:hypothetical protein [Bradyrhizobium sp. 191]|uniref:hypothetical protein n=1 Tax=Bradyrhizobium sp. 191 TaxID=2782659 RepID=UPI002000111D|nr:hypothetical protein [Bradyrhizobium sp. 191]
MIIQDASFLGRHEWVFILCRARFLDWVSANSTTIFYAYVEITTHDENRRLLKKVAVAADIEASMGVGTAGESFFDDVFVYGRRFLSQFWGLRTADRSVVDSVDLRKILASANLVRGILLTPFMGYGLPNLLAGIGQAWTLLTGSGNRRAFFAGGHIASPRAMPPPLPLSEDLGPAIRGAMEILAKARARESGGR